MVPPTVDMGLDEWLVAFRRACEEHGCEYLADSAEAGNSKELEALFEEGRTPEEAVEILHFS
jgi:hypothetical protein